MSELGRICRFIILFSAIVLTGCRPEPTNTPPPPSVTSLPTQPPQPTPTSSPAPTPVNRYLAPAPEGALARLGKGIPVDITYSPDGSELVIVSSAGVYSYRDGTLEPVLETGSTSAAYSPDGERLAVLTGEDQILVWDAQTRAELASWQAPQQLSELSFSPDGSLLAAMSFEGEIYLWDSADGHLMRSMNAPGSSPCGLDFSPDGKVLASASAGRLMLWNVQSGQLIKSLHSGQTEFGGMEESIMSVEFSPDGQRLITGGGSVYVWDAQSGQILETWDDSALLYDPLALSPDGGLAAWDDGFEQLAVWDVAAGKQLWSYPHHHMDSIYSLRFSPDGKTLAVASSAESVLLLDAATGRRLNTIDGFFETMYVAFSADGELLISWDWSETYRVWNLPGLWWNRTFSGGACDETCTEIIAGDSSIRLSAPVPGQDGYSADGRWTASNETHGTITLEGPDIFTLTMPGNHNPPASVTFSPDGRVVAAFDSVNHITWLWSTENGQPIVILPATDYGIAFSPDGSLLATSARGGGILIWEMDALVSGAPSAGPTATAVSYASSAAPSGCALTPGLAIHTSTDARLWSAPDALNAQVTQHAAAGQALFVIGGPQMGAITGSAAGWYWEVTTVENGPSAGWVWQGRILECP